MHIARRGLTVVTPLAFAAAFVNIYACSLNNALDENKLLEPPLCDCEHREITATAYPLNSLDEPCVDRSADADATDAGDASTGRRELSVLVPMYEAQLTHFNTGASPEIADAGPSDLVLRVSYNGGPLQCVDPTLPTVRHVEVKVDVSFASSDGVFHEQFAATLSNGTIRANVPRTALRGVFASDASAFDTLEISGTVSPEGISSGSVKNAGILRALWWKLSSDASD